MELFDLKVAGIAHLDAIHEAKKACENVLNVLRDLEAEWEKRDNDASNYKKQ